MSEETSGFGLEVKTKRTSRFSKVFPNLKTLGIEEFQKSTSTKQLRKMFPNGAYFIFEANEERAIICMKGDIKAQLNGEKMLSNKDYEFKRYEANTLEINKLAFVTSIVVL